MTSKTKSAVTRSKVSGWFSCLAVAAGMTLSSTAAWSADLEKVSFRTNWFPQAEHGGWYYADSQGTYEDYGLDVDMKPGGPQVNNIQLLLGGVPTSLCFIPVGRS